MEGWLLRGLAAWACYLIWCWAGFAVTDRTMGRDRFFQWCASCGPMGYIYAGLWPFWVAYYFLRR